MLVHIVQKVHFMGCHLHSLVVFMFLYYTRSYNKVRELIVVKVLRTSLLNTTMVAFKVLPLGS